MTMRMITNHIRLSFWQEFKGLQEDGIGITEEASSNKREEFGEAERFFGVTQSIPHIGRCFLVQN